VAGFFFRAPASYRSAASVGFIGNASTIASAGNGMNVTAGTFGGSPRPSAPAAVTAGKAIPSLDGIRAVSILIVFLSHAGLSRFVPASFGLTLFFSFPVT